MKVFLSAARTPAGSKESENARVDVGTDGCAIGGLTGRSWGQQMEEQRVPRQGRTEVTII